MIDGSLTVERTIGLEEVISLGEQSAEFRRGIVQSEESLGSIVDCSIEELRRLRDETGEQRLKIIASAIDISHCIQITGAFRSRGLRAEYVHSREGQPANDRILRSLDNHEIDVIVQSRMLGEGFDHKYLSVAMVGNIFANLSPFVQFVGRVMRAIVQNSPDSTLNRGVVVFHAGANVAKRWDDFRSFSHADQAYFAELLPEIEGVNFDPCGQVEREPGGYNLQPVDVVDERDVRASNMDPIGDPETEALLRQLAERGISPDQAAEGLRRVRTTRQDNRNSQRAALNDRIQNEAGGILGRLQIPHVGKMLDHRRQKTNYQWVVSELNNRVNRQVGGENARRQEFTLEQLEAAHSGLLDHVRDLELELRNGD